MTVRRTTHFCLGAAFLAVGLTAATALAQTSDETPPPGQVQKNGIDIDVRSLGKQIFELMQQGGTLAVAGDPSPVAGGSGAAQIQTRRGNVQVNDPGLDNIQILSSSSLKLSVT